MRIEKDCGGCNWKCSNRFLSNIKKGDTDGCPCGICIVKMVCQDMCQNWLDWARRESRK